MLIALAILAVVLFVPTVVMLLDQPNSSRRATHRSARPQRADLHQRSRPRQTFREVRRAVGKTGAASPIQKLYGPDRIGIVGFHDDAFIIAVPAEPYADWLQHRSQRLHDKVGGSGTNLTDGLRKAVDMLGKCPRGVLKRIWLLTDGYPNRETDRLESVLESARRGYINVNTIGFGDAYDEALLRRIAGATHNGKFVPVRTLRQLTDALLKSESRSGRKGRHQSETTILVIDVSPSMNDVMEGKRKVAVVEEAVLRLLHYKRECFA